MENLLKKIPQINKKWYIYMIMPSFLAWMFFGRESWVLIFMSINAIINIIIFLVNNRHNSKNLLNSIILLFFIIFLWLFMTKRTEKLKNEFLKVQKSRY